MDGRTLQYYEAVSAKEIELDLDRQASQILKDNISWWLITHDFCARKTFFKDQKTHWKVVGIRLALRPFLLVSRQKTKQKIPCSWQCVRSKKGSNMVSILINGNWKLSLWVCWNNYLSSPRLFHLSKTLPLCPSPRVF